MSDLFEYELRDAQRKLLKGEGVSLAQEARVGDLIFMRSRRLYEVKHIVHVVSGASPTVSLVVAPAADEQWEGA